MNEDNLPVVNYDDGIYKSLYVDGELMCSHDRLYPLDILEALSKRGIIILEVL